MGKRVFKAYSFINLISFIREFVHILIMPIDVKKLLEMGRWGKKDSREMISNFLKKNWKQAFTSKEIYTKLKLNPETARTSLRILMKKGEVERVRVGKNFYYFFKFKRNRRKK